MHILFVGEIFGESGKKAAATLIPKIRQEKGIDFVIANGENASKNGYGVSKQDIDDLLSYGIDCITSGECIWNRKEIVEYLKNLPTELLRPANYPPGVPGRGYQIYEDKIGVINLLGRVFLSTIDCPFRAGMKSVEEISAHTNIIIVDFHAQTTSEKEALGWYLDGKVSAVIGSHTHIQTADDKILPGGTAYITDIGMTGAFDSVIGVKKEKSIEWLLKSTPTRFDSAQEDVRLNGVIIDIDESTGKSTSIERVSYEFWL